MLPAFIPATISSVIVTGAGRPIFTSAGSHSLLITLMYPPGGAPVFRAVRLEEDPAHGSTCSLVTGRTSKKREKFESKKRKNGNVRTDPEDENGENTRRLEGEKTRGHPNYELTYATIIYDPFKMKWYNWPKRKKAKEREKFDGVSRSTPLSRRTFLAPWQMRNSRKSHTIYSYCIHER